MPELHGGNVLRKRKKTRECGRFEELASNYLQRNCSEALPGCAKAALVIVVEIVSTDLPCLAQNSLASR